MHILTYFFFIVTYFYFTIKTFLFIMILVIEMNDEEIIENYELSEDEIVALANIDLMKMETTSIYKYENSEKTTKTYALAKDKESSMHDDRFYVLIMLAHRLYELRRGQVITKPKPKTNVSSLTSLARKPRLYSH